MTKSLCFVITCASLLLGCAGNAPTLGVNNGQLQPCPDTPNCVSSFATDDKSMPPIDFNGSPKQALSKLLEVIKTMPRTQITEQRTDYVRAEFSSKIFGFVDDVEFLLLAASDKQTTVHFRSASRLGYSDLGVNRQRIEQIKLHFRQAVQNHNE